MVFQIKELGISGCNVALWTIAYLNHKKELQFFHFVVIEMLMLLYLLRQRAYH